MALLPFDDWIYHLPYKRDEVNNLYKQCVEKQNLIDSKLQAFNVQLDQYRELLTNNSALLLINSVCTMNELDLKNFQSDIQNTPIPENWSGYTAVKAVGIIIEVSVGLIFAKVIFNMRKVSMAFQYRQMTPSRQEADPELMEESLEMTSQRIGSVSDVDGIETLYTNEASYAYYKKTDEPITEDTIGEVTTASSGKLIATGVVGILVAVGIDVIFGAINGKKTLDELNSVLDELREKMKIIDEFIARIDSNSEELRKVAVKQMDLFKTVCSSLEKIYPSSHKPNFSWDYPSTLDNLTNILASQKNALDYFSLMPKLRTTYTAARNRNPGVQKQAIISTVLLTAPEWVTESLLNDIWDIMIKYSLASSQWVTKIENRSHWTVIANGTLKVSSDDDDNRVTDVPYSASGVEIIVQGKGKIFLTDNSDLEREGDLPVYGVHVISGSFDGTYFPDLANNAMYVSIKPDGTFDVRPGINGIAIEMDTEDHAAVVSSGAYIKVPSIKSYNFGDFSISANFLTNVPGILVSQSGAFSLEILDNGIIKFGIYEGTSKIEALSGSLSSTLFNGEWHYIVAIRQGTSSLSLFLDGKNISVTISPSSVTTPFNLSSTSDLKLGGIVGSIRNISLWNCAISSADIQRIWFNGCVGSETGLVGYWSLNNNFFDLTSNHNNGSNVNVVTFFPVIHCIYLSSGTNQFSYCAMNAIHTTNTNNLTVSRKQTVTITQGAPYLYASITKTGDQALFPNGVVVTVTNPSNTTFGSSDIDQENLYVLTNNGSLWSLVVKDPSPGNWVITISAPSGVCFKFEFQTAPSSDISQTIFKELAPLYGLNIPNNLPLRRSLRAIHALSATTSVTSVVQFFDNALAIVAYQTWAAVLLISYKAYKRGGASAIKALTSYLAVVSLANASSFLGTIQDIGLMEATKKLLGYSNAIPSTSGTSTIYVWTYRGSQEAWGHASIGLSNGTHISWWPSAPVQPLAPYPFTQMPLIGNVYEAPAFPNQTYADDCKFEGQPPDYQIPIKVLNESNILTWWNSFRLNNKWRTLDNNCSTAVMKATLAGGATSILSVRENTWLKSVVIWTPADIVQLGDYLSAYNP